MSLSSWYAVLLRAFPRHYRRTRGEEMLGTLLDGARPGQTRPSIRDVATVIGAGLRCRVRLRRGPATLISAVAASITGSFLLALLLCWAAWTFTSPPLPGQAEADAIMRSVVSSEPARTHRYDFVFGDNGFDAGSAGYIEYEYDELVVRDPSLPEVPGMRVFLSHNTFGIMRATPPAVPWLTILGAILGAYAGWTLAARSSRLVARRGVAAVTTTILLASTTFVTLAPLCLYAAVQFIQGVEYGAPWIALHWEPTRVFTVIGLLSGALTLLVAETGRPRKDYAVR